MFLENSVVVILSTAATNFWPNFLGKEQKEKVWLYEAWDEHFETFLVWCLSMAIIRSCWLQYYYIYAVLEMAILWSFVEIKM